MFDRLHATEATLLLRLRGGDEAAFVTLVDGLNGRLLALARTFTSSPALAEDIVQETWLGVIRGLRGFEGRASIRTWIFSILVRRARTMAARDARRSSPKSAASDDADGPRREWTPGAGKVGLWNDAPVPWDFADPASVFQSAEALQVIRNAVDALPERQRQALLLRDVEDMSASEVCNILDVKETNLRVLLHRGRARVREALDGYLRGTWVPQTRAIPDSSGRSVLLSSPSISATGDKR
jgi:RNA polymerase sigma-70 factor (ECF subfamily)